CTYDPAEAEPSRETGIPRTAVIATENTPGAGGTVANNLAALGCMRVAVLGVIGCDGNGWELKRALAARGIELGLLLESDRINTFTYTKLLNRQSGDEDQPRVDYINQQPLPEELERQLIDRLHEFVSSFDVVLISDQAETATGGVVTAGVREAVSQLARRHPEKVFWADSRLRPELFRDVILKPNEDEAAAACRRALGKVDFHKLQALTRSPLLYVTHGSRGVAIYHDREEWVDTEPVVNPVDICGAGDSFSAGAAIAFHLTRDAIQSAVFGNLVASITIMKKGTGTASPTEVRQADMPLDI
ncbi:MAG: ribokinase, partial [Candidatus Solibacter usitatus]|nr:ribokinase [Candidatus Solibacter usitatus]